MDRRFQTVSKLDYKSFYFYNGGADVIKELKIVKTYSDFEFKKALRDFKIEKTNYKKLLPKSVDRPVKYQYIWWR
ncbi:hypothetical protein [Deferribacter autotrophicus]|uniref:hypothetical protein n=1 Tax=Deferribacter autotrophicus TaxID=500465 RepID=UPI001CAA8A0C|nr:hypothetical protein [Deferribacter autotrophicus]